MIRTLFPLTVLGLALSLGATTPNAAEASSGLRETPAAVEKAGGDAGKTGKRTGEEVTKIDSDTLYYLLNADIAVSRHQNRAAYEFLSEAMKHTGDKALGEPLLKAALMTNTPGNVEDAALAWHKLDPDNPSVHRTLLARAIHKKDRAAFNREVAFLDKNDAEPERWLPPTLEALAREPKTFKGMPEALEKAVENHKDNAAVLLSLARYERALGMEEKAVAHAEEAQKLEPDSDALMQKTADFLWRNHQDRAVVLMEKYLDTHPDAATVRVLLARALVRKNETQRGIEELKRAMADELEDPSERVTLLYNSGLIAGNARRNDLAREYFEDYIRTMEEHFGARSLRNDKAIVQLANLYVEAGEYKKALEITDKVTEEPLATQARIFRALALDQLGRTREALPMLEKLDPAQLEHPSALYALKTELYLKARDKEKAMKSARLLLQEDASPRQLYAIALLALDMKDRKTLEESIPKIRAVDENEPLLYVLEARIEDSVNKNPSKARHLLERAYKIDPLNPLVLWQMGLINAEEGRWDQAVQFTLTSLKLQFNADVAKDLVRILMESGRTAEAKSVFEQLLQRSGHAPEIVEFGRAIGVTP